MSFDEHPRSLAERMERISTLRDNNPLFLPSEYIKGKICTGAAATVLVLTTIFVAIMVAYGSYVDPKAKLVQRQKTAYQLTNTIANVYLILLGLYYIIFHLPRNPTFEETVIGHEEYHLLSSFQLGYQLWALPVGIFLVNESLSMLAHHVSVVLVCIMSGTFTCGFRYWTPHLYGLIECSSLPLALMNYFKDNPKLAEKYPLAYSRIRLTFAWTFLIVRMLILTPKKLAYVRDQLVIMYSSTEWAYKVFMFVCSMASILLVFLQLYWAALIVKGLVKFFISGSGGSDGKKTTTANGTKKTKQS